MQSHIWLNSKLHLLHPLEIPDYPMPCISGFFSLVFIAKSWQNEVKLPEHSSVRMRNSVIPWDICSFPDDAAAMNFIILWCPFSFFCIFIKELTELLDPTVSRRKCTFDKIMIMIMVVVTDYENILIELSLKKSCWYLDIIRRDWLHQLFDIYNI